MQNLDKSAPHFSIVMPTLNRDKRLRLAIDSVLQQTFTDFELIVVDDASENEVQAVVDEFKDSRIMVIKNKTSLGAAAARNKGIGAARGEWLVFLDDDDVFFTNRLEAAKIAEMVNPEAVFGICAVEKIYEKLDKHKVFLPDIDGDSAFALKISTSALSVKRAALQELGGFDCSFAVSEDRDLVLGLLVNNGKFYVSTQPLVKRVFHNDVQLSKQISFYEQARSDEDLLEKYKNYILQRSELYGCISVLIANSYSKCAEYQKAAEYYSLAAKNVSREILKYRLKSLICRAKALFVTASV